MAWSEKSEDVKRPLAVVAYFVMEKFSSLLSTINFLRVFSRPSRASFTRSPRARATATSSAFSRSTSAALASPWRTTDASTGSCASTGRRGHSRSGRRTGTSYQCEIQRHCHCDCNTVVFYKKQMGIAVVLLLSLLLVFLQLREFFYTDCFCHSGFVCLMIMKC